MFINKKFFLIVLFKFLNKFSYFLTTNFNFITSFPYFTVSYKAWINSKGTIYLTCKRENCYVICFQVVDFNSFWIRFRCRFQYTFQVCVFTWISVTGYCFCFLCLIFGLKEVGCRYNTFLKKQCNSLVFVYVTTIKIVFFQQCFQLRLC